VDDQWKFSDSGGSVAGRAPRESLPNV
jgi:hypothetical protein